MRVVLQQPEQRLQSVFAFVKTAVLLAAAVHAHHELLLQQRLAGFKGIGPGWRTHTHTLSTCLIAGVARFSILLLSLLTHALLSLQPLEQLST